MNKRERTYTALEGQPVDQVPFSFWRHFYKQDQTPTGLASATLAFYKKYNLDLIKLTPSDFYAIEDWGVKISTPKDDDTPPRLRKTTIKQPEDWTHLTTPGINDGAYGRELETIKLITSQLNKDDAPLLMTLYSPLTIAYKLAGDILFEHLKESPTEVHIGLATIAETTARFAKAILNAGADGIYFMSQLSRSNFLTQKMCQAFVVRYDLIALEWVRLQPAPLILYLAGENIYFDTVNQYPIHAVSWDNHHNSPSVIEALSLTDKTLMTGIDKNLLKTGYPDDQTTAINQTIATTGGTRLILAPAGFIAPDTPPNNLAHISQARKAPP